MQEKRYTLLSTRFEQSSLHNLPAQFTTLIGREREVMAICKLLRNSEVRLLTLTGTPGVGKTHLALQVARELVDDFADGVWFVPLASIRDPDLLVSSIAKTFDNGASGSLPLLDFLQAYLQHKRLLLVLDNFEQLVTAAPLLTALLEACPQVKMLVTSREVLHLRAERQFLVSPLALPDLKQLPDIETLSNYAAVALFLQRGQAVKPHFQLTPSTAAAIAEICVHLDGIPLAIELAAVRIKFLSPQSLLARLDRRLQVLTNGARDLPERQQTLLNMIKWSYELLNAEEQRLFQRLSVFVGGCTLEATEAVATEDEAGSVLDGMTALIDKSLLQQIEQEGEEPRFMMLETIREFALDALTASGKLDESQKAHALYYLELAEEAKPSLRDTGKRRWLEQQQRENENLRAALTWLLEHQEQEAALRLSGALWRFWWVRGYLSEGRTMLARALAGSEGVVATHIRAKALFGAGLLADMQGDYEQAEPLCRQSLALFQAQTDLWGSAISLTMLGYAAMQQGNYMRARSQLEQAVTLFREVDDKYDITLALVVLAQVFLFQGEYDRACALVEEATVLDKERGDSWKIVNSLWLLAMAMFFQSDLTRTHALLEEGLALARQEGYKEAIALSSLISGWVVMQQGDVAIARSLLEESLKIYEELGGSQFMPQSLNGLAMVSLVQGNYAEARALLEKSLSLFQVAGNKWFTALCLAGFAILAAAQGEWPRVARLSGEVEALCETIHGVLPSSVRVMQELSIAAARAQLPEEAFTKAWTEGRMMTPEQALAAQGPVTMPMIDPAEPSSVLRIGKSPTYPNELTSREVEVLRLLAQGMTSAQIAEQLTLSLLTVNTHVRSIYSKLGVTSRSAATRWAIEHQLV